MGLGRTSGQRSAEIMAGIRAELEPTQENIAMTRLMGRIFARILTRMQPDHPGLNYVVVRPRVVRELIRRFNPHETEITVVEVASGFSTMSIQIAASSPKNRVVEIDLPDVVAEKKARLKRGGLEIPPNLSWRAADLGVEVLDTVLEGQLVEVIVAAGLLPYFPPEQVTSIARHARMSLKDGGVMIADVMWRQPMEEEGDTSASSFYKRQSGSFQSLVDDEAGAKALFAPAGFSDIQCIRPSVIAAELGIERKVIDFGLMVVARK